MPLRLVLDTNVWLDWLVFEDPGLAALKSAVSTGHAEIVIDDACEEELIRVLAYPLQKWTLASAAQARCLAHCRSLTCQVEIRSVTGLPRCTDTDDQKFIDLAAGVDAGWLLTKDRALLTLDRHRTTLPFRIVTPADFASTQA